MTTRPSIISLALLLTACGADLDLQHSGVPTSTTVQGIYVFDPDGYLTGLEVDQAIYSLLMVAAVRDPDFNQTKVLEQFAIGWPEIHMHDTTTGCGDGHAMGCYYSSSKQLWVYNDLIDSAIVRVLIHEVAHFLIDLDSNGEVRGHPDLYYALDGIVNEAYTAVIN
jgi:hypothetical protein